MARNRNQIERSRSRQANLLDTPKAGTLGSTLPDLIVRLWCTACGHSVDAYAGLLAATPGTTCRFTSRTPQTL